MSNYKQDALDYREIHDQTTSADAIIKKIDKWINIDPIGASLRWPFELIQNALDTAPAENNNVVIEIELQNDKDDKSLIFRHNAGPFSYQEIYGLIHGGSTKTSALSPQSLYIGQFGTGFLISHILNRKVKLIGIGLDKEQKSHKVDVIIDRTSNNAQEISNQIRLCIDKLDTPEIEIENAENRPFAQFTYVLNSPAAIDAAEAGIKKLESLVPWILATNPKLAEVRLTGTSFTRHIEHRNNNSQYINIFKNGNKIPYDIMLYRNNSVSIAIQIEDGKIAQLPVDLPRIFISMPLLSSENIHLPFIISSPNLEPDEERGILALGEGEKAVENKRLLAEGFKSFYEVIQLCIKSQYGGLHNFCSFMAVSNEAIKNNITYWGYWQTEIIKSINILAKQSLVVTDQGYKTPHEVIFPITVIDLFSSSEMNPNQFADFFDIIKSLRNPVPQKEIAYEWQNTMRQWKKVDTSLLLNLKSLHDILKYIVEKSLDNKGLNLKLDKIATNLEISSEILESVLVKFYELTNKLYEDKLIKEDFIDGLLLTQDGKIRPRTVIITDVYAKNTQYSLHREDEKDPIPNEFKDIVADIAFDFRRIMLDTRLSKYAITQAFVTDQIDIAYITDMVLTPKYRPQAKTKVDLANKNHLAWVKLLSWCLLFDMDCSEFPVFSKDLQVTIWNKTDSSTLHILPFNRIGVKPKFEELMPESRVLCNEYFSLLSTEKAASLQNILIKKGVCFGDVLFKTATCKMSLDRLRSIIHKGDIIPDDREHKFNSSDLLISSIPFHDQIIGRISQVPPRAKLFFEFLFEVICQKDLSWQKETTVTCSCHTNHTLKPAEWLAKVKCDAWVPKEDNDKIVQREATKESIDYLMKDELKDILQFPHGVDLLEQLGYERLDLSIMKRSLEPGAGHDEKQIKDILSRILDNNIDVSTIMHILQERESRVVENPKETLFNIYDWWMKEKKQRLLKYDMQTYTGGKIPNITPEPGKEMAIGWREEWLKLFLTSILQTMGRQNREQHREFVNLCSDMGLLKKMAENGPWLELVTQRFKRMDSDVERYYHWFEKTIGLHLTSVNLNDYALLYSWQINYFQNIKIEDLTMPGFSTELQGGGPNLPPVRKIFGRGINFMLRELARPEIGIITKTEVFPYCYVGFRRVRRLLKDYLGSADIEQQPNQSTLIYKYLASQIGEDKANFGKCFDIPLEIISEDPTLIEKFFGKVVSTSSEVIDQEDF